MKKITQKLTKSIWQSGLFAMAFLFSLTINSQDLTFQGIVDFSLPGKYMKAVHVKATADIADLSVYSIESYSSEPRLEASAVLPLSGSASAGDDILFWFSNAENAANLYMNASGIFDVVVNDENFNVFNGDDPLTLSMNGTVVETYGELGVDGSGEAWEYLDTWAYKVDGAWTHGTVNCTDGSYFTWDSGCAYPLAVGQQATGASTDLVTAFSENMNVVPSGGFWYNDTEAPIERKTASNVPGSDTSAMMYTDSGEFAYSNMQIQFTSKVDMSSMNTYTVDVYVDGTTTSGTAPVNLALKLQDSSEDTPWTNQNVLIQDITADTWTTLTFTFNDDASMSRDDVDRIVVQFNGEGNNDAVVAYMKNMVGSYTEPAASAISTFPYCSSFDTDLGDWTTNIVQGDSDWTSAASNTTTGGSSVDALSGGGSAYYYDYSYAGNGSTLISTAMDISAVTNPQVTFQIANPDWSGDQETVDVWYKAAAGDDWAVLGSYSDSSTTFSEVTLALPNASSDYYVAFNATSGYGYGVLIDDVCIDAAPISTSAVTFNVDMSQYGLADGDTVHVNGEFTGWCGDCGYNVMSDDDGDGVYTLTLELEEGSYFWKYTVNGWTDQESFTELVDGCTAQNGANIDRQVVVGAEAIELSYCWNSCEAAGSCSPVEPVLMPVDHENENVTYAWNDFGGASTSVIANPDASGINTSATVAQSIKTAGSETWAGTFIVLDEQLDFSTITTLAVDVWTPDGGELVNLKVENSADSYAIEINQPTTVASGWETLYYDLSGEDLSLVYNKLVFFFDFNVAGDDTAYYFDNIRLEAAATAGIDPGCSDFEDGGVDWTVVDAGGLTSDWLIEDTLANGDSGQSFGHGYLPDDAAYNDWLVSPAYNTTGLSAPTLSYYEYLNWSADAQAHNVYYSTDYAGDATTATWVLLNDVIGTDAEDTWVQRTFALPSAENVVVSFQYSATYGADWNIDDVCVQEDTLSTVDATLLDMRIYPNPSNGSYVTIQSPVNGVKYVEVFDITGKRLINTSLSADTLDVSSISSGMYLVKVTIEGQSKTSKLIIR